MDIKQLYSLYKRAVSLTTDSRNCPKGSIFLALKGASFDGNKFARAALDKGCSLAIVDEPEYADPTDERIVLVSDALTTYKELAREHRRQFGIPVVGITGTNGKTTTKELVSAVLAERYRVMHTEANYNNDVGVPRTLLQLRPDHEIAVVEMGASHPGDIDKLVRYVEPTCGLITNVGRAHLQGFGSFEGVKRTKGELYDFLQRSGGLVFLNASNPDLVGMARERGLERIVSYGTSGDCKVRGQVTKCDPYLNFTWTSGNGSQTHEARPYSPPSEGSGETQIHEVRTHLIGAYNIDNMLAAITVGLHFGVSPEQIGHALESYEPTNDRSELLRTAHNELIVDAYNANPSSMAAALDNFELIEAPHKMAILGDMRELGDASADEHQKVADRLSRMHLDDVWLVGDEFGRTDSPFRKFKNVAEVESYIQTARPEGECILIKGSNGIRLFELVSKL